jgi:photosystem II stability/assembly factor-like uncharacterized protein
MENIPQKMLCMHCNFFLFFAVLSLNKKNNNMKKILLAISALYMAGVCNAQQQWTPLNSTTTEPLNDVDFLDPNYGVIVGNHSTILLTTDGGSTWSDINNANISGDVFNVRVQGVDTIFVSIYDWSIASGTVYYTSNGGVSWTPVAIDNALNHRIDLEARPPFSELYVSASNLMMTNNAGTTWDTLLTNIGGTTSTDLLRFADSQTGSLSGNISGFVGYSAYFFMTTNGGANWYRGESTLFPNADAHTTMSFANADTAYFFMNQYAGWAPGPLNRLVRVWNFNQSVPFPGDTVYTFSSAIVDTLPDYMNDARFENTMDGLALGNNGKIYRTVNGGTSWTVDYADTCATCPLMKMDFEGGVGYAVGGSGILVKYDTPTGVKNENANELNCTVYPNPSQGIVKIKWASAEPALVEVTDVLGNVVSSSVMQSGVAIDLSGQAKGVYFIQLTAKGKVITKKIVIE